MQVEEETSTKGWNWGVVDFSDSALIVKDADDKQMFSIPAQEVAQAVSLGKGEFVLEFQQDDTRNKEEEYLVEMRFHVPDENVLAFVKDKVTELSGAGAGGESIALIEEVPLVIPRGHHDIEFLRSCFKLRGKSFSYTVKHKNVTRLFLLAKPDDVHVALVIALEQPLRQGNTAYPYLVLQFDKHAEVAIDIQLPEDQAEQMGLAAKEEGKLFEVLVKLFKALTGKSVSLPETESFKVTSGQGCVRCSHRALEGHLYCLKKGFLFVNKPVVYIKFEDVAAVEFSRTESWGTATTKYFDLKVYKKNESSPHDFQQIDRAEYQALIDFLQSVGIRIRNLQAPATKKEETLLGGDELPSDDDSADEDFGSSDGDSEDSDDSGSDEDESEAESEESPKKKRKDSD